MEWWNTQTGLEQVLLSIAIIATTIFLVQTLLTLLGGGDDFEDGGDDFGEGIEVDSFFEYFTIRNIIAFALGFSWGTLAIMDFWIPGFVAVPIGLVIGLTVVLVNMWILTQLAKLDVSGNMDLAQAIGHEGKVSIEIPANGRGSGKIVITFDGRERELMAKTDGDYLKRGRFVQVTSANDSFVTVESVS